MASPATTNKLGRVLLDLHLVAEDQIQRALSVQTKQGGRLGGILVRLGYIDEIKLLSVLSQQYGVPSVDLATFNIDPALLKLVPKGTLKRHLAIPVERVGSTVKLAMVDPSDISAIDEIKFVTGYNVEPLIATESAITQKIAQLYASAQVNGSPAASRATMIEAKDYTLQGMTPEGASDAGIAEALVSVEDFDSVVGSALDNIAVVDTQQEEAALADIGAPIIKLVNGILVNAINVGASDVHVEPYETVLRVRFRIDGIMKTIMSLPLKIKNAIISRLKIMASLDIAERRLPQDGRIKLKLGPQKHIDFRVSSLPCLFGEKVVLRLLNMESLNLDMTQLGFEPLDLEAFLKALAAPYGMVLVTGPTGSGKTTTLYSAIRTLNTQEINIMTVEDPVEYNLMGINQVQVKEDIGLSFVSALRSFLRQDPDVVLVGEIRDRDTAEIAVKAALTGHLVLSTLHTNDAPSAVVRLVDMGIAPFLVSSSVILIVAQRLARKICTQCKQVDTSFSEEFLQGLFGTQDITGLTIYKGAGCDRCSQTGYRGRIAMYETMPIGEELRHLILKSASLDEVKATAIRLGMRTLRVSGLEKIRAGVSTPQEIIDNTFSD